ncbi:MAG: DegT/DnrJ/EryC1/StrS family aminotransferase [Candidatus Omnitrophica bacterium]|nr:DegT/DnrJ/EryC1/StrS family aminotransferase [Candidatus Omnitrophota bacterium]MDD5237957.1 DegT/DnrJ/EryC1/StrS family aminotransferase [Candidatus Omnitrophota bacterium]
MSIFKEIPPTAGFPFRLKDLLSILARKNRQGTLENDFKGYLGVSYARLTCSGTAAFYIILESLKNNSTKRTVIIPSFVCPLLPLAINRAGFKARVCDINKDNFNFDIKKLEKICSEENDILAILAIHLGGIPIDFDTIKQICERKRIFIIEDCAQSLGAVYKGKKVGTLGDFSFFSLCRGKGVTIYEGGLIVSGKKEYFAIIDNTLERLVKKNPFSESLRLSELFGYWLFYRPFLFWFVYRLPQIYWSWRKETLRAMAEYFTIDFPLHEVSAMRNLIGHLSFLGLEREIEKQREKAYDYLEGLRGIPGIKIITESPESRATYPYLTLLFDSLKNAQRAQELLKNSGLGVSRIYNSQIKDYEYLKDIIEDEDCPNARYLAQRQITLTTSTFLAKEDLKSVVKIIKNATG